MAWARLLRADLLKMARRGLVWWLAAAAVGATLIRGLVFPPAANMRWPGLWSAGLVSIAVIMLAAVTAGQELAEGTWRMLAGRGVARWRLVISPWVAVVLVGGVLLLVVESLAVLLGVRHELAWAELLRAWLALWPLAATVLLLAVLGGSAGLPLILGALLWSLEQAAALVLGSFAMLGDVSGQGRFWDLVGPDGPLVALYRWTLTFNSAMWTYEARFLRMPSGINVLAMSNVRDPGQAGLLLVALTVAGLALAVVTLHRRELGSELPGRARRKRRVSPASRRRAAAGACSARLPLATGRGPLIVRLAYACALTMLRTSLVRVGAVTMVLFVLAEWAIARQTSDPGLLFRALPGAAAPLGLAACLIMVGLLAGVIGILAISNEQSFGTRRALLGRGVTRLQALAGQSLAILATVGGLLAGLLAAILVMGAAFGYPMPVGRAAVVWVAGLLLGASYVGAAQVGAAFTRSTLGPMVAGLAFLVVDWLAIVGPTMTRSPEVARLGRFTLTALAYGLVTARPLIDQPGAPAPPVPLAALIVLAVAAILTHALAAGVAGRKDV